MASAIPLVIALLKAAAPVGALVNDRIDPEISKAGATLPRIVVRQSTGRQVYGLTKATGLREGRVTVLCAAKTFTAADRVAQTVIAALMDVRHAAVGNQHVTIRQEGEDTGTAEPDGSAYTRIVGFYVSMSS